MQTPNRQLRPLRRRWRHSRFSFGTRLGGALAGAFRPRVEGNQFSGPSPLTSLPTKKLCLIFGICWVASSGCFGKDAYRFLSEIPIGGEGGWDILTIDSTASRLYLSHATKVVIVDLNTNSVTGEIADTPGVHAFVADPKCNAVFRRMARNRNRVSLISQH